MKTGIVLIVLCIFLIHYIRSIFFHMKEAKEFLREDYSWIFVVSAFIPFKNHQEAVMFQTKNRMYHAIDEFFDKGRK